MNIDQCTKVHSTHLNSGESVPAELPTRATLPGSDTELQIVDDVMGVAIEGVDPTTPRPIQPLVERSVVLLLRRVSNRVLHHVKGIIINQWSRWKRETATRAKPESLAATGTEGPAGKYTEGPGNVQLCQAMSTSGEYHGWLGHNGATR